MDKKNRFFHVTPSRNCRSIMEQGLIAQCGERSSACCEGSPAVWLFPSVQEMENALMGWLGEEFEDEDALAILQIDLPDGFPIYRDVDSNGDLFFEAYTYQNIPKEYISAIVDEDYEPMDA